MRRRALREPTITLKGLLDLGRAMELSETQASGIESQSSSTFDEVNYTRASQRSQVRQPITRSSTCGHCGNAYPHPQGQASCPARGAECRACGKLNHFARVCRSKPISTPSSDDRVPRRSLPRETPPTNPVNSRPQRRIRHIDSPQVPSSGSDDEYLFSLTISQVRDVSTPKAKVMIANVPLQVLIDTGASINVIDETAYQIILKSRQNKRISLRNPATKIYSYGGSKPLPVLGMFVTHVESKRKLTPATIYVIRGAHGCLLSYKTATELDLISINTSSIASVHNPTPAASNHNSNNISKQYPDLFTGIGKMKDFQVELHIDPSVPPVTQPHRRIPFHLRKKLDAEIDKLERQGIIEPVDGPTPWVSPLVVTPKPKNPDEIRLCVDMRQPNRAILRERHITPTVDDLIHDLNGSTAFSKIDLNSGYHQLELAPASRYITTFSTHRGLRRYTCLNFGTSSAAEVFQDAIQQILSAIDSVRNVSDDIIIFGRDQQAHDPALQAVFTRLRAKNLTLNPRKCEFNKSSIEFFWLHVFQQ